MPLHLQECFQYLNIPQGAFPISEQAAQEVMSLPMNPFLTDEEIAYIVDTLKSSIKTREHARNAWRKRHQSKIYTLRNVQVMLDRDLAELYGVETKRLNEQVKRNIARFPESFRFQLTKDEFENWKSQIATSNSDKMGLRRAPYAFTEQVLLCSVLF